MYQVGSHDLNMESVIYRIPIIFSHPWGLTKAERKAFHLANVIKFQTLYAKEQQKNYGARIASSRERSVPKSPEHNELSFKRRKTDQYD